MRGKSKEEIPADVLYSVYMILPADTLRKRLEDALRAAYPKLGPLPVVVDPTKDAKFGEYTCTVAMRVAPLVKASPQVVAAEILKHLETPVFVEHAAVVGPGFLNFTLKASWMMKQAAAISTDRSFGQTNEGKERKYVVEFISANPTGPMTLANGRGAFSGDTMANILTMTGWKVTREYYVNDVGNQVNILAESVIRRYYQQQGIPTDYPDYCYQGEYITDLAKNIKLDTMKLGDLHTLRDRVKGKILATMIADIKRVVTKKLRVKFDSWFLESSLYTKKLDVSVLEKLRTHDFVFEKEGATWFKTTAFGDDKDRVLIKQDGEKTYFLSDIALRWQRFAVRKFERELLFLGADHHGYIGRLQAAVSALGYAKKLDVFIVQLVRLLRGGQEVKMSKRAGTYVTIEEVIDEVGLDAARFFFLMHGQNTHMDFNLDLAKERSEKNPVYYAQYAHARMCSILAKTKKLPLKKLDGDVHPAEKFLIKTLWQFPYVVREVADSYEVQKVPFYAMELARAFHDFYTNCRVIDEGQVMAERLALVEATKHVLAKTLGVMGVSAPVKM